MKKTVVTALMLICFMFGLGICVSAEQSEKYEELLLALDILDADMTVDNTEDVYITRAEFIAMVVKAFKYEFDSNNIQAPLFTDVVSGHWAHGYIVNAYRAGIISGYPDGTFRPDNPIMLNDAVSVCMNALNYKEIGNTSSSIVNLRRRELTKEVKGNNILPLTYEDAYVVVFNTLHAGYMDIDTITSGEDKFYTYSSAENVLSAIYDIEITEDIVNADPYVSLYGYRADEGQAVVGNTLLKVDHKTVDGLIGYNVCCYYKREDMSVVYIYKNQNEEFEADFEDVSYSDGRFTITNENSKKSYSTGNQTTILLNNCVLTNDLPLLNGTLFSKAGKIKIIRPHGSETNQTIILNQYDNYKLQSVDSVNEIIKFTNGGSIPYGKYKKVRFLNEKKEDTVVEELHIGQIVSVIVPSDYESTIIIMFSSQKAEILVKEMNYSQRSVVSDEEENYTISVSLADTISDLSFGNVYNVYFDAYGEIAYWDIEASKYEVGYIIKVSEPGVFKKAQFKMLTSNGEIIILDIKKNIKVRYADGRIDNKVSQEALYNLLTDNENKTKRQLVMYRTFENLLSEVCLAAGTARQDLEFHQVVNYADSIDASIMAYRKAQSSLFGQFVFKDSSVIFLVPKQSVTEPEDSDFMIRTPSMFNDGATYNVMSSSARYLATGYAVKENGFLTDYMVIEADYKKTLTSESAVPVLVTGIRHAVDDDGCTMYKIDCVGSTGAAVVYNYYDVDNEGIKDLSERKVNIGDIVRIVSDEKGKRTKYGLQTMWDHKNKKLLNSLGITYNFRYDAQVRVTTAKVIKKDGEYVQLEVVKTYPQNGTTLKGTEIYNIKNAAFVIFDADARDFQLTNYEKVAVNDEFLMYTKYGEPKTIIYYEKIY